MTAPGDPTLLRAAGHPVVVRRLGPGTPGHPGAGTADGPPVVLVHGIGVSGRYFGALARTLARSRLVLVPDLVGFGSSPRAPHPLRIVDHAAVLHDALRQLEVERPVLVGHSMGTQVVVEMAASEPGSACGVVLIGPVIEPGARSLPRQAWRLARDTRFENAHANRLMVADWLRCGPRWYAATVPTMLEYPTEDRLADLDASVTLVRGRRDPVAPSDYLHRLALRAPRARVVEVEGEGHIVMVRRPGVVADLVREHACVR